MGFADFIRERQLLANVSPSTLEWYKYSFKWLRTECPSQDELKDAVLRMREKGLKATSCNSAIRAINTYVHWVNAGPDVKCSPACKHPKIAQLKEPQLVLPTFTEQQVRLLVSWKPNNHLQQRLHLLVLFLLDTGCRISEALKLRISDIDFENLLVTLDGKGRKQRVVPFSFELRRAMFRYCKDSNRTPESTLFANRLSLDEFLRRFLLHLLPKGFVRIRHFGFLANRRRATLLPLCRQALTVVQPQTQPEASAPKETRPLWLCPNCGGPMVVIERLSAAQLQLRSPPLLAGAAA